MKSGSKYSSSRKLGRCYGPRFLLGMALFSIAISTGADGLIVKSRDRTDWWSINNEGFRRPNVKPRNMSIASGTFEIGGVSLGRGQFDRLATKLGKAVIVERGDASTGRQQICYVVSEGSGNMYLIFEFGEDESAFYLFSDGPTWNGREHCTRANHEAIASGTGSGLTLGLTIGQVEALLGKADAVYGEKLVYSREEQQKTTPVQFSRLRKEYPEQLDDADAHKKFDYYSVGTYVEARFGKSGLNYLAVSRSNGVD